MRVSQRSTSVRKQRQHQMHIWISQAEYKRLQEEALHCGETVSMVVRRLISTLQTRLADATPDPAGRTISHELNVHKK